MLWPACSPDLNPHRELLVNTKAQTIRRWQYSSKNCVWEEIQSCAAAVDTIKTLTDSSDGCKRGLNSLLTIRTSMFMQEKDLILI